MAPLIQQKQERDCLIFSVSVGKTGVNLSHGCQRLKIGPDDNARQRQIEADQPCEYPNKTLDSRHREHPAGLLRTDGLGCVQSCSHKRELFTCTDNILPTSQIPNQTNPNQKPWMNSQVRHMLHARFLAFRSGDEMEYKSSKYKLRKTIKEAKQLCQQKLEGYYSTDTRRMWQGLQLVTDYKGTTMRISNNSTSLPDELNQFYCCFETHNRETERTHVHTWDRHDPPPSVSSADVHMYSGE
ncbi:hypothetical protein L3Q82_007141 [Scortum barcoo]|uniref:Uncharacterized protein n=1 Tax=Scortum barcoo TaxID=214431 RepID=A0ACB8WT30_9TELE|nr:hypothetical protein L3Q82_007141 [Scortum barcoo]